MGIKKDVFKMKLNGNFQLLMEYAFVHGYRSGINRNPDATNPDLDRLFIAFMETLDENLK